MNDLYFLKKTKEGIHLIINDESFIFDKESYEFKEKKSLLIGIMPYKKIDDFDEKNNFILLYHDINKDFFIKYYFVKWFKF